MLDGHHVVRLAADDGLRGVMLRVHGVDRDHGTRQVGERLQQVPLPYGVLASPGLADQLYEALSRQRVEVAPVSFGGAGYLRIAAAPYNTPDDYDRLAGAVTELLDRAGSGFAAAGADSR
jgi:hypothetical protein